MSSSPASSNLATGPLLDVRQLSRLDQTGANQLLKPTDFILMPGAQIAITGASGSGKSVFLRTLALLDAPATGEILWQRKPVPSDLIPVYRTCVCYLSQRPALIEGTVLDNLQFPYTLKSLSKRAFNLSVATDLLAKAGKDASFLSKPAGDLSGGESQIVALIRALQLEPQVMLFDEPTSALDPQSAAAVESLVKHWFDAGAGARAYLWVSHDPEQARRMSTRHLTMNNGELELEESV
ncbi:ATP-binding cassette domain-containing protein [Pseudomonas sp. LS-2]|uniref:ABC transporter ATP-binding protein n=1 Tax=Pseudomonas sp. LS-2 TaxID=2315859 RepID=UPI002113D944|nr:ATP-binding cassette domain-containing protein [Pseudomonas sp. LS-2]